ncbi:MAG: hypothetical protein A2Z14_18895 [Chloroflexi bacterium RBG_16_48_8]|nr:MAG: hypothetical protein A2Z14_18895 [Chloroflexi bacterium RBG_16_48_8]
MGHILAGRNTTIELLGGEPLWDGEVLALYRSGSEPISDDSKVRKWDALLMDLEQSQSRINNTLDVFSNEQMDEAVETERGLKPIWEQVKGLLWHETYHVGQIEIYSQYAQCYR